MRERRGPLLLLTQGDPAGIGPELTLKTWMQRLDLGVPPFAVLTDPAYLTRIARSFGWNVPIKIVTPAEAADAYNAALPVIPLQRRVRAEPGKPVAANAASVIESIEMAVQLVTAGEADGLVTNPDLEAHSL